MEHCPLEEGYPADLPGFCMESCEGLWDKAIVTNQADGEYDCYNDPNHREAGIDVEDDHVEPCRDTTVEYSHSSLAATSEHGRSYVIVDVCGEGHELGEQGYAFTCPYSLAPRIDFFEMLEEN